MPWNMPAADSQGGEETAQETMQGWSVREKRAGGTWRCGGEGISCKEPSASSNHMTGQV